MTFPTHGSAQTAVADINNLNYFKNIHRQNYLATDYLSGEKYRRQHDTVRRAISEKAQLITEAYRFSQQGQREMKHLPPQRRNKHIEAIFQKYCTFYAYSNNSNKYRNGLHDIINENNDFYRTYTTEESRALAKQIKIRTLAHNIDNVPQVASFRRSAMEQTL